MEWGLLGNQKQFIELVGNPRPPERGSQRSVASGEECIQVREEFPEGLEAGGDWGLVSARGLAGGWARPAPAHVGGRRRGGAGQESGGRAGGRRLAGPGRGRGSWEVKGKRAGLEKGRDIGAPVGVGADAGRGAGRSGAGRGSG